MKRLKLMVKDYQLKMNLRTDPRIRRAVVRTVDEKFDAKEGERFTFLESLREDIIHNNRPVEIVYYGEGTPTLKMSREQMAAGVRFQETTQNGVPRISSPPWKARLLFNLIRECRPETALELGTGYGISGLYEISALDLNEKGHFFTVDGSKENQVIASELFTRLNSKRWTTILGPLQSTLTTTLQRCGLLDFVFFDADHSYIGTKRYFEEVLPFVNANSVLAFDDIAWSDDMTKAWTEIAASGKVKDAVDVRGVGLCVKA